MKGEITLDGAIALLSSEKIKDRTDGLAGLSFQYRTPLSPCSDAR